MIFIEYHKSRTYVLGYIQFKIIKITEDSSHVTGGYRNGEWVDDIRTMIIEAEVI